MGDAENTLPPSKKRAAGRELSRDNPGLDDEDEVSEQESGTFKRASEEVLANRRIVKVRRSQTSSTPAAPSSNPFAAIRLVPPTDTAAAPATASKEVESQTNVDKETEKVEDDGNRQPESKVDEAEAVPNVDEEKNEGANDARKPDSTDADTASKENEPKEETDNEIKKEKENKNVEAAAVSSFQQLSSSQNAFTGLVGTGFSNSTFSFGPITKSDQPTFPSFSFGTNGNSSLVGSPVVSIGDKNEVSKTPSMQEVAVETGEENEEAVFTADSVLFMFIDGGWKERGKGELKVNVSTTGRKARLVMRARGNYRLILNASLFPDMKLTNMEKKGITFACLNSTGEGKDGLSTFALKFKDVSIVDEFRSVVTQRKSNTAAAAPTLKTPENSPKASDE